MVSKLLILLTFAALSLSLVSVWFKAGLIYGGGDVGLQVYNPPRILEIARYVWWEATAPGSPVPQGLTAVPFNFIFSFLKLTGFNPLMLQATLFFLILFFMGWGMYRLIVFILGNSYQKFAVLGGIFYVINPYMMVQVWHRFVHPTFFFVAALPFFVIFWIKWLRFGKPTFLFYFSIINLLALYAFGTIAYILTLWLILALITICEALIPWKNIKYAFKIFSKFSFGFLFWLLVNGWWLVPIFSISPALLSQQHTDAETLSTLINLGYQTVIPYSLQLTNPFYLFHQLDFGSIFQGFIRIFPWIFVVIVLTGLIRALFEKGISYLPIIYILVLFLSKGVASPFGYPYIFGVQHFFFIGVLRNPFEKIGVLLPLVSSLLFVIGCKTILHYLKGKFGKIPSTLALTIAVILIFSFCLPMFTGKIFGKFDKPEFVEVPQAYIEADEFIRDEYILDVNKNPGKILHLPLTRGESITYNWPHGYSGLESSALFFTAAPSISHGFNIKRVDDSMEALYLAFHSLDSLGEKVLAKILQDFNVRFIIFHKDVKWQGSDLYNPQITEDILNKISFLTEIKRVGDLIIYKIPDENFGTKITVAGEISWVFPPDSSSLKPWILTEGKTILTPINGPAGRLDSTKPTFIFAKNSFVFSQASSSANLSIVNQLVSSENNVNIWLDALIKIKPVLKQNGELQAEEVTSSILDASKKITKILKALISGNETNINNELKEYEEQLRDIFKSATSDTRLTLYVKDSSLSQLFQTHLFMLKFISQRADRNVSSQSVKILDYLEEKLYLNNLISKNLIDDTKGSNLLTRNVLRFEIPQDGLYEILFTDNFVNSLQFNIDGETVELDAKKVDNLITFGAVQFLKGDHEISFPTIYSGNLPSLLPDSIISIDTFSNRSSYSENKIEDVVDKAIYKVSFDARVEAGNGFYFQLLQDTDNIDSSGKRGYQIEQFISQQSGQDWVGYNFTMPPLRLTSSEAAVRFLLPPSNGQLPISQRLLIKNLKVERQYSEDVVLKKVVDSPEKEARISSYLDVNRNNPVSYKGKIHLDKPSFVVFSETYHPGWKLTLSGNGERYVADNHLIANLYANAYFLDKTGDFDFTLYFEPQRMVHLGAVVAILCYIGLVGSMLRGRVKK